MASTQHRTPSEWAQLQTGQGLAYRFLGRCFYEAPDAEWIATLAEERLFEAWPFPSRDEDTTEGLSLLRDFCESWDPTKLGELQWDFTRLFVGPGKMLVSIIMHTSKLEIGAQLSISHIGVHSYMTIKVRYP